LEAALEAVSVVVPVAALLEVVLAVSLEASLVAKEGPGHGIFLMADLEARITQAVVHGETAPLVDLVLFHG